MPRGKSKSSSESAPTLPGQAEPDVAPTVKAKVEFDFAQVQGRMAPDSYFAFTASYPKKDQAMEYLYRMWPKIDRKKLSGDQDKYIEKVATPFTRHQLMRKWGSGEYLLMFNDQSCRGAVKRAECIVEIDHPDFPAIIEPGTLELDHPKNKAYVANLRGRGELPKEESMSNLSEALLNRALTVIEEKDSKPVVFPAAPDPLKEVERIASVAQAMGFVRPGATAAPDPISEIQRIMTVAQAMGFVRPDGAAPVAAFAAPAAKSSLIADIVPLLREVNAFVAESLPAIRMLLGGGAGVGGPIMSNSAQNVGPAAVPFPGQAASPGTASPASADDSENNMNLNFGLIQVLQAVGPQALSAFAMGIDGDAFAHGLCKSKTGERQYEALFQFGSEGILEAISVLPNLDQQLSQMGRTKEQLAAFVSEFVQYGMGEAVEGQASQVEEVGGNPK